jgi:hypothetical protein
VLLNSKPDLFMKSLVKDTNHIFFNINDHHHSDNSPCLLSIEEIDPTYVTLLQKMAE